MQTPAFWPLAHRGHRTEEGSAVSTWDWPPRAALQGQAGTKAWAGPVLPLGFSNLQGGDSGRQAADLGILVPSLPLTCCFLSSEPGVQRPSRF